jgi:hypothetical protein
MSNLRCVFAFPDGLSKFENLLIDWPHLPGYGRVHVVLDAVASPCLSKAVCKPAFQHAVINSNVTSDFVECVISFALQDWVC